MSEHDEIAHLKQLASEIDSIRPSLQELGFKRDNILILNEHPDYSAAIDVIFMHLQKPYLSRIREALGRLMAHPSGFKYWREMVEMYRQGDKDASDGLLDGLAYALSELEMQPRSPELRQAIVSLLRDRTRGNSRIYFLDCFRRKRDKESMDLIDELASDPDLKKEIGSWKRKPR